MKRIDSSYETLTKLCLQRHIKTPQSHPPEMEIGKIPPFPPLLKGGMGGGLRTALRKLCLPLLTSSLALFLFFSANTAFAATTVQFENVARSVVTMGNTSETIVFRVTNTSSSSSTISAVQFAVNSSVYNIAASVAAPSGWAIQSTTANTVCFTTSTAGITKSGIEIFKIALTGPSGAGIASASADVTTDSLLTASLAARDSTTSCSSGTVFTVTNSTSWNRRALAVSWFATPSSVAVGGTITLTALITNRSTATQSGITAFTGHPLKLHYATTILDGYHDETVNSMAADTRTGFADAGTIMIDGEDITYNTRSNNAFNQITKGANGTTNTFHADGTIIYDKTSSSAVTLASGPTPSSISSLAAGASDTITWTYTASAADDIYFVGVVKNSSGTATSRLSKSNMIGDTTQTTIGDFTAVVSVDTMTAISGQDVTVTMVVTNTGSTTLATVTPTLSTYGTATISLLTGPTPSSFASLAGGKSATFTWTYDISGSSGQTWFFQGYATAGASTTNTSTSQTGTIDTYSVTMEPTIFVSGATNTQVDFTVYNGGSNALKKVDVTYPSGWAYSSGSAGDWTVSQSGSTVTFTAGTNIPSGGWKLFSVIYSLLPTISVDTPYTFYVKVTDTSNNTATKDKSAVVVAYTITLSYSPAGPVAADGASYYTLTATLTQGGTAVSGALVTFDTKTGTLSSATATTDSSGIATVYLIAPCSTSDINNVKIKTWYQNAKDNDNVSFSGVSGGNLVYVGNSLTPKSVSTGYASGFTLQLKNCGSSSLTVSRTSNTAFDFANDSFTLTNSSYTISSGSTTTIGFSGTVASSAYKCLPLLKVDAGASYTGAFSYNNGKSPVGDYIDDYITISSGTACNTATIIEEWREMR